MYKLFDVNDQSKISYFENGQKRQLSEQDVENLKQLSETVKNDDFLNKKKRDNDSLLSDPSATEMQRRMAENDKKQIDSAIDENQEKQLSLLSKFKSGLNEILPEKVETGDLTLDLVFLLLRKGNPRLRMKSQFEVGEGSAEKLAEEQPKQQVQEPSALKGFKVPPEAEEQFYKDLSLLIDLPKEERIAKLIEKGYEYVPLDPAHILSLEPSKALVVVAKDSAGNQDFVVVDSLETLQRKSSDEKWMNKYFHDDTMPRIFTVDKSELSNAIELMAADDKIVVLEKMSSCQELRFSAPLSVTQEQTQEQVQPVKKDDSLQVPPFDKSIYASCKIPFDSVDWDGLAKSGINVEDLHNNGQLEKLLNGEISDLIIAKVRQNDGTLIDCKCKLQIDDSVPSHSVSLLFRSDEKLEIPQKIGDTVLSDEERKVLSETGQLDKLFMVDGHPKRVYVDKDLNLLCMKTTSFDIPDVVMGRPITLEEKAELMKGNQVELDGLKDSNGKTFKAVCRFDEKDGELKISQPKEEKSKKSKKNGITNSL